MRRRCLPGLGLLLAATLPVQAQDSIVLPPPGEEVLAGTWRVESFDRFGAKREIITFSPRPDRQGIYDYIRRPFERVRGEHQRRERGEAELTLGRWITTREFEPRDIGLVAMFRDPNDLLIHRLREGIYKLQRKKPRANGFSSYPGSLKSSRERLFKMGDERSSSADHRGRPNNDVRLLVDGNEFFPLLRSEIEAAQHSISLQTFIFTEDSTGRSIARLLSAKAREGVQVRMLLDGLDSKLSRELREDLRRSGVELIIAHGWVESIGGSFKNLGHNLWNGIKGLFGGRRKAREERGIFNHDHRKIVVIDGRVGFCGGMNMAREYEHEWHDVHARVEGDAVKDLQELFFDRWKAAGATVVELPEPDPRTLEPGYWPGNMSVDVLETLPGVKTEIRRRYEMEIDTAERRVWIECAYFLDDHIIRKLRNRAHDGLDVAVIVPDDDVHDVSLVRDAFSWVQNDVVRSGIRLYKYRGRMVHSKVASFDGRVATVGSSNLDNLALEELGEANLFVNDREFTRTMDRRVFEQDFPRSRRVKVRNSSWWQKVKGGVLHFFRKLL